MWTTVPRYGSTRVSIGWVGGASVSVIVQSGRRSIREAFAGHTVEEVQGTQVGYEMNDVAGADGAQPNASGDELLIGVGHGSAVQVGLGAELLDGDDLGVQPVLGADVEGLRSYADGHRGAGQRAPLRGGQRERERTEGGAI